ncbi:MAG: glycosyltransferase family 4 protein, partial [Armatimonadota bacterium]
YGLSLEATLANMVVRKPLVLKIVGDLAWERSTLFGWVKDSFEEFQRQRYAPKVELLKRLQAWWVRQADTVVVHSRSLVRRVEAWGVPPERLVVIPNAIVIPNAAAMPGRNGIATLPLATTLKVVTVARLVPWKGIEGVIEAATAVDGAGLVVVGDGPDRPRLERYVRTLGMADRVYFAGQQPRDETLALMAASDIFVLNSAWEGLSHTLLEAMALGLPVIATAVGASPEIVRDGETGRLIPPDDSRALRDALQSLAASPSERVRLAAGARRTVQRFSASVLVEEMEALLAASIARRNGRRAIQ